MDIDLPRRFEASGYTAPGFPERYDRYRPHPPTALLDLLPTLVDDGSRLAVIDLGSGTGLSTRCWADRAAEVIGVEPNDVMRRYAETHTHSPNVRYLATTGFDTGLPDASTGLITAAQSLQWMEPELVFPEIGRLLRPGGVFCAYQYFGLVTRRPEPGAAWEEARSRRTDLLREYGLLADQPRWPVSLARLDQSGVFRYTNELAVHSIEPGDGDRLVGFASSEGWISTLLAAGASEEEIGPDRIREAATLMPDPVPWWISYRAWIGLK